MLTEILDRLWQRTDRYRVFLATREIDPLLVTNQRIEIVDAMRALEPRRVAKLVRTHVAAARSLIEDRLAEALGPQLAGLGVATLHEAAGRRGLLQGLRLLVGGPFAGPALTVALPAGDNLGIHLALEIAEPASVLCVGSAGGGIYGVFGDLLYESARDRGLAGLVVEDGIRDIGALSPPPSLAAVSVSTQGTIKSRVRNDVGSGIALGGVFVESGDWIVCDHDGAFVVPAAQLQEVLARAMARETKESGIRQRLRTGEASMQILGLPEGAPASLRP